jgi:hypothetical protein
MVGTLYGTRIRATRWLCPPYDLVPAIHDFAKIRNAQDVDARHKAGHDELIVSNLTDAAAQSPAAEAAARRR